ncbi:MAG: tetratricopeptide repeat protein [Sandaracinobacteroides sp.]
MRIGIFGRTATLLFAAGLPFATFAAPAKPRDTVPAAAPARGLPDNQIAPLSLQMLKDGETALAQGKTQLATDSFEAALAADPRNRRAYLGMARAAEAEGMPGKAVSFYREALEIDPNDIAALELQGMALVERGAKARAEANLERVRKLCTGPCPQADRLSAAIARGPSKPAQTAALDAARAD